MSTTFNVEWGRDHENWLAHYDPSDELDPDGWPEDYDLRLKAEVLDWCERTECEVPTLSVEEWDATNQEFPSLIGLTFTDDALAQLFRLRWLHRVE